MNFKVFPRDGRLDRFVAKGVRQLPKAESVSIGLPPTFQKCELVVTREDETKKLHISKGVAEELIALGLPYEG